MTGERATDESQPSSESQPRAEQNDEYARHFAAAAKQYADYDETIATADRAGHRITPKLEAAIRAVGNAAEIAHVAYALAKNPELIKELENDPSQLARISPTARHTQLSQSHNQRMMAARKADPDAAAVVDRAASLPIRNSVTAAVLEQDNSEALVIHFAKNPEVLEELNELPPSAAMSRVGDLRSNSPRRLRPSASGADCPNPSGRWEGAAPGGEFRSRKCRRVITSG